MTLRTVIRVLMITAPVCLLSAGADAQPGAPSGPTIPVDQIEVDAGGRCDFPRTPQVSRLLTGFAPYSFITQPTFVSGPRLLRRSAAAGGAPSVTKKVKVFGRAEILGTAQQQQWALVRTVAEDDSSNICGWLPREALLLPPGTGDRDFLTSLQGGPRPLLMKEFSTSPLFKSNVLPVRAVLHNSRRDGAVDVVLYSDLGQTQYGRRRLFDNYDVYAIEATQGEQYKRYLLLGSSGRSNEIVGWVKEDEVYIWPTRMAVYWAPKSGGSGWSKQEEVGNPQKRNLAQVGEEPSEWNVRRFPVLSQTPNPEDLRERLAGDENLRVEDRLNLVTHYEVVLPATACRRDAPLDCIDAATLQARRDQLEQRVRQTKVADILFVIDATESMGPYLQATFDAINNIAQNPNEIGEIDFRLGVMAYGDYKGKDRRPPIEAVARYFAVPLTGREAVQGGAMRILQNPKQIMDKIGDDDQRDLLEAPFAALTLAAKEARWRSDAATRAIIHVADHGNRGRNQTFEQTMSDSATRAANDNGIEETVGIDRVVQALREAKISYWPVAVFGGGPQRVAQAPDRHRRARQLFQEQAEQIARGTIQGNAGAAGTALQLLSTTFDPGSSEVESDRVAGIQKGLRRAVQQALAPARVTRQEISCAENRESQECKDTQTQVKVLEPVVTQIFDIEREARGISKEATRDIALREQIVDRGWLPPRNKEGRPQLSYWMAVDPFTLNQLRGAMSQLCRDFEFHAQRADSVERTLGVDLSAQVGRGFRSLGSALEARFSIPANYASRYFAMDLQVLKQTAMSVSDAPRVLGLWQSICRSSFSLAQVQVRGTRFDPQLAVCTMPRDGCNSSREECVKCTLPSQRIENYRWEVPDVGATVFYVPVEYLP